ncbi:MAG: hypothetical protein HY538_00775 [Deltaproteobacteria bacterium]|nr:hypothetical protein [Deltaproteobacteria bacterium]
MVKKFNDRQLKGLFWILLVISLGEMGVVSTSRAELVDRTEVIVNRQVITWRQLQVEARLQAIVDGEIRSWKESLSEEYLNAIRDRLVDRTLLLQEASRLRVIVENGPAVEEEFQRLKKQFPVKEDWEAFLHAYDLDLQEVRRIVEEKLVVQSFLETRVTPLFRLSAEPDNQGYEEWIEPWMDRLRSRSKIERLH